MCTCVTLPAFSNIFMILVTMIHNFHETKIPIPQLFLQFHKAYAQNIDSTIPGNFAFTIMATVANKDSLSKRGSEGLRTPRVVEDAPRGLASDYHVTLPIPQSSEDFVKRFGPLAVEVQQALTAILMLDSPETNIVIDSLNALQKFLKKREENKELYVEIGGLPPIQKRIFESHTVIQRMCMKILALASTVHQTKLFIRNFDIAKDLLKLAETKDDVIVEYSTCTLANFATLHTGRLQIIQQNGLPILIGLLSHADPDIQRNAMETIWQISADPLHLGLVTNKEYVAAILRLVESEYPPLQAIALLTIERIACRPEGIANLESLNSIAILANKLTNETMVDLHRHCLRIFFHQCRDRGTCRKFAFLAPAIAELIERTPDAYARMNGVELLGRLCSLEHVAKGLAESGLPLYILSLFNNPESDCALKEACAFTTAQISRCAFFSKKEFAKCLPALLEMVGNENTSRRGVEYCLVAISSILEDIMNSIGEFVQASGFDVLRKLFENAESYSDDAVLSAMNALDIIAGNPSQRLAVIQGNFLPILLTFLHESKNPQIHAAACNILCSILCEKDTHEEFSKQNGPEAILNIIASNEFPVVIAAVTIVNVACSNPVLGKELVDKGLLKVMWQRTDLITRNGPIKSSFERLIETDLSLKYAITGHLSPFERIENGFCDMGGLRKQEDLRNPKDLTWADRDLRKRILLLNLGPLDQEDPIIKNNESLRPILTGTGLQDIIETISSEREGIVDEQTLVSLIARCVSDRFGGPLDKWRLTANAEEIEIESIQNQYRAVIVPISTMTAGAFRIRALVFKALCDLFSVPCSLETSDYRKNWNIVLLRPDDHFSHMCPCVEENAKRGEDFVYTDSLRKYVVDLVFQPGTILPLGSFEAETYITAH